MTPAAAQAPMCPLHLDTQIALHTLAIKTAEEDIAELKEAHTGLAKTIDQKFDRLHFWIMGIMAAAVGGLALNLIAMLKK